MAQLDVVRRRISLSDDEFETLRLVHNDEPVADEARRGLVDAGIVTADGDIAPLVLDLVRTVSEPMIECAVETAGPQGAVSALLAVREETVWYTDPWPQGDAAPQSTVYCQDELPQILWVLARLVGLRRREVPPVATPFTVPLRAIDAVVQTMALSEDAWEPTRIVATAQLERFFGGDIAEQDRTMLMATLSFLESTARVTLVWGPDIETDARGLVLWDCGPGGYWVREQPAEPLRAEDITPDTEARFRPVTGGEAWRLLAGLLPSSADLRAVLDRVPAP
ncbi:hypothetical protein [Cellulomonas xylanilytica]|uniref:Uncharacterized protein n=1 Tax=Cellulomonas xylanilytica TaxID=233583 RepID=A0A510UZU3_9CELL|nr:hypothetical protein [Cellulomonas xylanilytica]GEK20192.1 hypothetical protein CXY01_07120 [Cellulomonas xylanilytica]